jgi:sulfite exporter TauE/SafE
VNFPVSALLIGLWSSAHCLAMCGGLAIAAGQNTRDGAGRSRLADGIQMLVWQLGRVSSYGLMGLIAGGFGGFFLSLGPVEVTQRIAMVLANLLLIGLGLHLARVSSTILILERMGQVIWQFIAPLAQKTLLPVRFDGVLPAPPVYADWLRSFRAGLLWGWLPCGLTTSMVVTAAVSGSASSGGLWMVAFGLGTIPALWATAMASSQLAGFIRHDRFRLTMGWLMIVFGLWGLARALNLITLPWFDAFCITVA